MNGKQLQDKDSLGWKYRKPIGVVSFSVPAEPPKQVTLTCSPFCYCAYVLRNTSKSSQIKHFLNRSLLFLYVTFVNMFRQNQQKLKHCTQKPFSCVCFWCPAIPPATPATPPRDDTKWSMVTSMGLEASYRYPVWSKVCFGALGGAGSVGCMWPPQLVHILKIFDRWRGSSGKIKILLVENIANR